MSRISVIGGTGYAGAAITAEALARGHEVTVLSRTAPAEPLRGVRYVSGEATEEAVLARVISGADVVVAALAPRGALAGAFRDVYRSIARMADAAEARLVIVGGFSSLRPSPAAPRFVEDLSDVPEPLHQEVLAGAVLITEDLPAAAPSLDWLFISPARGFGSFARGQRRGSYRLGDDVAVDPDGGEISAADYALAVVDLIERADRHRAHVNVAH